VSTPIADVHVAVPARRLRLPPLWCQIIAGLLLGCTLGAIAGERPIVGDFDTRLVSLS